MNKEGLLNQFYSRIAKTSGMLEEWRDRYDHSDDPLYRMECMTNLHVLEDRLATLQEAVRLADQLEDTPDEHEIMVIMNDGMVREITTEPGVRIAYTEIHINRNAASNRQTTLVFDHRESKSVFDSIYSFGGTIPESVAYWNDVEEREIKRYSERD